MNEKFNKIIDDIFEELNQVNGYVNTYRLNCNSISALNKKKDILEDILNGYCIRKNKQWLYKTKQLSNPLCNDEIKKLSDDFVFESSADNEYIFSISCPLEKIYLLEKLLNQYINKITVLNDENSKINDIISKLKVKLRVLNKITSSVLVQNPDTKSWYMNVKYEASNITDSREKPYLDSSIKEYAPYPIKNINTGDYSFTLSQSDAEIILDKFEEKSNELESYDNTVSSILSLKLK